MASDWQSPAHPVRPAGRPGWRMLASVSDPLFTNPELGMFAIGGENMSRTKQPPKRSRKQSIYTHAGVAVGAYRVVVIRDGQFVRPTGRHAK
jgi:hypothetical protein